MQSGPRLMPISFISSLSIFLHRFTINFVGFAFLLAPPSKLSNKSKQNLIYKRIILFFDGLVLKFPSYWPKIRVRHVKR